MGEVEAGEAGRAAQVHLAHHLLLLRRRPAASGFHRRRGSRVDWRRWAGSSGDWRRTEEPVTLYGPDGVWAHQSWASRQPLTAWALLLMRFTATLLSDLTGTDRELL